jgi:hypothetical protein
MVLPLEDIASRRDRIEHGGRRVAHTANRGRGIPQRGGQESNIDFELRCGESCSAAVVLRLFRCVVCNDCDL